jgi:hypothetical protein
MALKGLDPVKQEGLLGVGIGMAGSGAILAAISLLVQNGYWFLVTGTVFVVIGIIVFAASRVVE